MLRSHPGLLRLYYMLAAMHRRNNRPFNKISRATRVLPPQSLVIRVNDGTDTRFGRLTFRAAPGATTSRLVIDQILTILVLNLVDNMPVNAQILAVGGAEGEEVLLLMHNIEIMTQQFVVWVPREHAPDPTHLLDSQGLPRSILFAIPDSTCTNHNTYANANKISYVFIDTSDNEWDIDESIDDEKERRLTKKKWWSCM